MTFRQLSAKYLEPGSILLMVLGIVFIVAGLGFKLGAVPFHMWVPDVYQGAPSPVTGFMAGAVKAIPASIKMRMGFMASSTFGQSGLRTLGFLGLDAADDSVKNGTLCLLN